MFDEIKDSIDKKLVYRITNIDSLLSDIEYTKNLNHSRKDVEIKYILCRHIEKHSRDFGVLLLYFHNPNGNTDLLPENEIVEAVSKLPETEFILIISEYPIAQQSIDNIQKEKKYSVVDISKFKRRTDKINKITEALALFDSTFEDDYWYNYGLDEESERLKYRDL